MNGFILTTITLYMVHFVAIMYINISFYFLVTIFVLKLVFVLPLIIFTGWMNIYSLAFLFCLGKIIVLVTMTQYNKNGLFTILLTSYGR